MSLPVCWYWQSCQACIIGSPFLIVAIPSHLWMNINSTISCLLPSGPLLLFTIKKTVWQKIPLLRYTTQLFYYFNSCNLSFKQAVDDSHSKKSNPPYTLIYHHSPVQRRNGLRLTNYRALKFNTNLSYSKHKI